MEGRDLSSSVPSPTTANRDGSSAADGEDSIFSVTVALAKDAALHFQSSKFAECVEVLNQLLQKKQDDPKVLHNIAIAEYFRDDCLDPKRLLEVLNGVKRKSNELACASGEQGESTNNVGNTVVLGSKGSNALAHQCSGANSNAPMYTAEFDSSVATLNIAIIWFHLHEYAKTLSVLEPQYQNIAPIDETTALHICLLLLDASLACHDASKSADVLTYVEKAFGVSSVSQGDNENTAQQQSSASLITRSSSVASSASTADASSLDLGSNDNASDPLSKALSEDTLDYETMILNMGGQNLSRPSGLSSNDLSRVPVDRFSSVELKLKLQLYKVRFLLLSRNLKLAKRELKQAMNIARGRDSSTALLLKSQLEYARGNHRKAIKLLMASSNGTDPAFSTSFNNNLGCIYYQLGKYETSSLFFSKALTNCSSFRKDKPLKLSTIAHDNSLHILYNCGVQYLACGKPMLAARCFQKASLVFYKKPLLWFRLAECCLMALEKGLIKSSRVPTERFEVGVRVIGKGKWRQLVVQDQIPRNGHLDLLERDACCPSTDGQLKLSLSLARQCLLNALHLLDSYRENQTKSGLPSNSSVEENDSSELSSSLNSNHKNMHSIDSKAFSVAVGLGQVNSNGDTKEQKGGTSQELFQNSLSYYEEICTRESQLIKQATLANLAYVELELDNPVKALSVARSLLELPECSRIYIFLAHVYAAEALCSLNRPKDAAELLSVYLSGGNNVQFPFSQDDCEKWRVERTVECEEANGGSVTAKNPSAEDSRSIVFLKPEEARATIYANFATMSAMQGEFERAQHFVTQALSILPNSPEAILTAVYVDLLLGKPQEALAKLKHCSHTRFLPSGVTLNKSP